MRTLQKKEKSVLLLNRVSGELWLCEDYNQRRVIDDNTFVEVHKPDSSRKLWININTVVIKGERK